MTFAKGGLWVKDGAVGSSTRASKGNLRRAIDVHEGDKINEKAFAALIKGRGEAGTRRPSTSGSLAPSSGRTFLR